jgi:hypothetical protein
MANMISEPFRRNDVSYEDQILFAYLLAKMPNQQLTAIDSMKWVFLIKAEAYKQQKVLFRARFQMFPKGPVSLQVYGTRDKLVESRISDFSNPPGPQRQKDIIKFSDTGYLLLEWIEGFAYSHPWAFDFIDTIYDTNRHLFEDWSVRQEFIYDIEVNGKLVKFYDKTTKESFVMNYYDDWEIFTLQQKSRKDVETLLNPVIAQKIIDQEKKFCFLASVPSLIDGQ